MLPREATEDTEACLVVRAAGAAGGPIDVRWAGTEVRVRAPTDATLAFEGVPVREAAALDAALKGFVGDFVGDCISISKVVDRFHRRLSSPQNQLVFRC